MKLGFCGLGLMGSTMVSRLLKAGHEVKVWNRSPGKADPLVAQGAQLCQTPAETAQGVEGVLMCLFDAASVEEVVFGPNGIAQSTTLPWLADHSTIAPDATQRLAQRLLEHHGTVWMDAPVSGGIGGAAAGTLAIMVGGESTHWDSFHQAVSAYAGNVTHMGAAGAGQATKLCNQIIVSSTVAAIAEALGFAERHHIASDKLAAALAGGWADSKPLQVFVPRMLEPQATSIGALSTMLKDVDMIMRSAQSSDAPMPITACVQQLLRSAKAMGLGDAELSALICTVLPDRQPLFKPSV